LTVKISLRGQNTTWMELPLGARGATTVTDRIPTCGIMNPNSTMTLAGEWHQVEMNVSLFNHTDNKDHNCLTKKGNENITGKNFEGSYKYKDGNGDKTTGYLVGKCSMGGMVCRSDWSEYPMWGVQLDRLLSDGTKMSMWWDGPVTAINGSTTYGWFLSNYNSTTDNSHCSDNSDDMVWPFKCQTFDTQSDCETNPYYCRVSRLDTDKCRKKMWKMANTTMA